MGKWEGGTDFVEHAGQSTGGVGAAGEPKDTDPISVMVVLHQDCQVVAHVSRLGVNCREQMVRTLVAIWNRHFQRSALVWVLKEVDSPRTWSPNPTPIAISNAADKPLLRPDLPV